MVAVVALAGCGGRSGAAAGTPASGSGSSATTATTAVALTIPSALGRTTTSVNGPDQPVTFTNVAAIDVATLVAAHCSMRPLLIPTVVASGWLADIETTAEYMSIVYRSPDRTSRIGIAIAVPNPPTPTGNVSQQYPRFRGDQNSLYQIDDNSNATSRRELLWTEPGAPYPPLPGIEGVPYYVNSDGVTETAFWNFAQSLHIT